MKPIRVLEVIRQGQIGGGESHLLDLVTGFQPDEVEPIILSFTGGHMIEELQIRGVRCIVLETQKAFDWKIQKQIQQIVRQEGIDLIHAHGSRAASNMFAVARRLHLPFVYTVHGWSFHQDQNKLVFALRALSEKLICHYAHRVICVSSSNRQTGMDVFGLKQADVIENGINLHTFNPNRSFTDIRQEFQIAENEFVVGFIARMTLQKAPLDFVKSIVLAHKQNPLIKGLLVGEGDMKQEVYHYIQCNHLEECFHLSDFRTDVPDLLHAIDVYCQPSLWEGLSIALLEAMAMKKPLVVTPTDGAREIIHHEQNGLIVDFHQPELLAQAYLRYASQPIFMKQCGENACQIVKERFDGSRVATEVRDIYRQVIMKQ